MHLRLATRGSALALTQSRWVAGRLAALCPDVDVELVIVKTEGDADQMRSLAAIGGRGVFVKAIEDALLENAADFAVHSLKDMPTTMPDGLVLAAVPEREDPRDALILPLGDDQRPTTTSSDERGLEALVEAARIGTSGPRRRAILAHYRPDVRLLEIRGNLDTRLRKLDEGQYDALVLAAAGLRRLGWSDRISVLLPVEISVPAVGQGALGIQCRTGDAEVRERLAWLDHVATHRCVTAERAALARLGSGCTLPFGAHAELRGDEIAIRGVASDARGEVWLVDQVTGPAGDAPRLGEALSDRLLAAGAAAVLDSVIVERDGG